MPVKLLIWDFDGTLAHRPGLWSGALLDVLDRHRPGHGVTREALRPALQSGFRWHAPEREYARHHDPRAWWAELEPVFAAAFRGAGVQGAAELPAHVRAAYLDPAGWQVYDDALPTLEALNRRGWQQVILSNHVPELPALVDQLGLGPLVSAVYTSAALGVEKPHPAAFRAVLDAVPMHAQAWMIGDSLRADVGGAAAVGLPAILVRTVGEARFRSEGLEGVLDIV